MQSPAGCFPLHVLICHSALQPS